jgi:hypothetical protein
MAGVKLKFSSSLSPSDPVTNPVVIIGNAVDCQALVVNLTSLHFYSGTPKNLAKISYNDMTAKFGGRVQEDVSKAISCMFYNLYLKFFFSDFLFSFKCFANKSRCVPIIFKCCNHISSPSKM